MKRIKEKKSTLERNHLIKYFDFIGEEEKKLVKKWYLGQEGVTKEQEKFLNIVEKALAIRYDFLIANMEPSLSNKGEIYYKEGEKVGRNISCSNWEKKAKNFAPQYQSHLANLRELFLYYAYRIAMGYWTLEYVCDNSSTDGNYWMSPCSSHGIDLSAAKKVGGARDGIGNTYKIVKNNSGFALCGGSCVNEEAVYCVSDVCNYNITNNVCHYGSGVLVLNPTGLIN